MATQLLVKEKLCSVVVKGLEPDDHDLQTLQFSRPLLSLHVRISKKGLLVLPHRLTTEMKRGKVWKGPSLVPGFWQLKIQSLSSESLLPSLFSFPGDKQKRSVGTRSCTCFSWSIKTFCLLPPVLQFKDKKTTLFITRPCLLAVLYSRMNVSPTVHPSTLWWGASSSMQLVFPSQKALNFIPPKSHWTFSTNNTYFVNLKYTSISLLSFSLICTPKALLTQLSWVVDHLAV